MTDLTRKEAWAPGRYIVAGTTVYALDESGSCNRFSALVQGGWKWRGFAQMPSQDDRTPSAELEATAALFGAAPELYEACDDAARAFDIMADVAEEVGIDPTALKERAETCRSALARARGESAPA